MPHKRLTTAGLLLFTILVGGAACGYGFDDPLASNNGDPEVAAVTMLPVEIDVVSSISVVAQAVNPTITAYQNPDPSGPRVAQLDNPVATGGPLVFRVIDSESLDGWLKVLLPVRPNGTTGWIRTDEVSLAQNPYRVDIDTSDHLLQVSRAGEVVVETQVAIGTGATPTPIGSFYLTELLQPPSADGPYGAFAFGLSGFSETLLEFNGGEGVIGIHGTNEPESLGTDVSHGCVRLHNTVITQLAEMLPLGTPVVIGN